MRIALIALLIVHGLIHLLGVVSNWRLATVSQMTGRTLFALPPGSERIVGALWLLACVALVAAAVMVGVGVTSWWLAAAIGVLLSQALVIHAWPDAKAGTLANLLLVVPVLIGLGEARFAAETDRRVDALFARVPREAAPVVTAAEVVALPAPVRRWLEAAGVIGKPRVRAVRLRQRGALRTAPDQAWMPAAAVQYFTVDEPGFIWAVQVRMMKVLPVVGRDSYEGGHGRMLIKAGGLVTVVDGQGDAIDQGTMLRFLGEIIWFPSAALAPYITWTAIDDDRARATMSYRGVTASAELRFDAAGRVIELTAQRFMGSGADARLQPWVIPVSAWGERAGVTMPVAGEVTWRLAAGDFAYYRWEITDVEYDRLARYR